MLIASAFVLAAVGELAYQRSISTLSYGIGLTEARISSAQILQWLTDAENARHGYLLTDNASYLEPINLAERELRSNKKVFDFMADIGSTFALHARQMYDLTMETLSELLHSTALVSVGDRPGGLALMSSGAGKQKNGNMTYLF